MWKHKVEDEKYANQTFSNKAAKYVFLISKLQKRDSWQAFVVEWLRYTYQNLKDTDSAKRLASYDQKKFIITEL